MSIYSTTVKSVGSMVSETADAGMYVLFGGNAPDALREYCFLVEVTPVQGQIAPGQTFTAGSSTFPITAVGDVVNTNLHQLGHMTVQFDGATTAPMPGTMVVANPGGALPELTAGTPITIA